MPKEKIADQWPAETRQMLTLIALSYAEIPEERAVELLGWKREKIREELMLRCGGFRSTAIDNLYQENYELQKEAKRLEEILKREDICPRCGENEASRFCKCA